MSRPQPTVSRSHSLAVIGALMLLNALNYVDRQILAVLVVPIRAELGLSNAEIGLMSGLAFAAFYALFGIPIAWLADRTNRAWLLSGCLVMWSGMTALCGMAQSFTQLFLCRIGVGVGEAGCTPAAQSLIADIVPAERRASALSLYSLGIPLGSFIGLAVGGYIAQDYGWRMAFMIVGLPGVAFACVLPFIVREPRRGRIAAEAPPPAREVLRALLGSRAYLHTMAACSLTSLLNFGSSYFMGFFFAVVHGKSLSSTGLQLAVVTGVGGMIGISLGGFLSDWAQRHDLGSYARIPAWALLAGLPFAIGGYFVGNAATAMALLIVPAALNSVVFGPGYAIVQATSPARSRALSLAIFMMVANLVGIGLGPALVGEMTDQLSTWFLGSNFAQTCAASNQPPDCLLAEISARRIALAATAFFAVWAALHLFAAARNLRSELRQANPH